MINISDLKTICEMIEKEYGADSKVVLQMRNEETKELERGAYCQDLVVTPDGTLFMLNVKAKETA